jgi:hypothetical protein
VAAAEDTTMGVRSRPKRRRKAMGAAGDLISGHLDDVLQLLLDAVRTAALSQRRRGLWRRIPALHFSFYSSQGPGTRRPAVPTGQFVDPFRVAARTAAMERLSILFDVSYPLHDSPESSE